MGAGAGYLLPMATFSVLSQTTPLKYDRSSVPFVYLFSMTLSQTMKGYHLGEKAPEI